MQSHKIVWFGRDNGSLVPYLLPEQSWVIDAPLPKFVVRWKGQLVFLRYMLLESIDLGAFWI